MKDITNGRKAPPGFRWVFTRFRKTRDGKRILDAWDYGYRCWAFLVPA